MSNFIDLTGMVFADGNIEVIKNIPNNKRKSKWECKCICGNIFIADGYSLRTGRTKSCGCKTPNKFIDLTGMIFGKLKVIERAKNKNSKTMWLCECECGNKTIVSGDCLKNKHTSSCGCFHKEDLIVRNKKDKKKYNTYDLTQDYGIGYTFKGKEFLFDIEDYDKIKDFCWGFSGGYIVSAFLDTKKKILFHRLIMDVPDGMYIDHINHNTCDNRKKNLRIVTSSQNSFNRRMQSNNTSGITGVFYAKDRNKWRAFIKIGEKQTYLGQFDNKEDAIKARKEAEEKYFGEYSYDNSMKGDENNE